MREWKFQEVRDAVTGLIGDWPANTSYIEVPGAYADVMRRTGLDLNDSELSRWLADKLRDKLWNQVRRALDELSGSQGVLVKVGRGQYHPGGFSERGATYYPMANYERADAAAKAAFRERDELAAAWVDVHARLEALGLSPISTKGQPATLDLDSWQHLLSMLDTSQAVQ